jgi:hypothetical protein
LCTSGQSAIGTSTPDASAKFEVYSTNQGFLAPRVTLTGTGDVTTIKNAAGTTVTPATGLMVYNTATAGTGSNSVTPGYYAFNGSSWDRMGSQPTTIVNATNVGSYRTTPYALFVNTVDVGADIIGAISLPPGKWQIVADYTCAVNTWGNAGGDWGLKTMKFNTYWINDGGGTGVTNYGFPAIFSSGEITSDALVSGGAVSSLPFGESQKMSFLINNTTGGDKAYELRFRESYSGLSAIVVDGYANTYENTTNLNRLYAIKIQ